MTVKPLMTRTAITTTLLLACVLNSSYAANSSFYVAAELGEANTHYNANAVGLVSADVSHQSLMPRVAVGYQMHPQFAVELGYLPFRNTKLQNMLNANGALASGGVIRQYSVDVLAKVMISLQDRVGVFAKLGTAYLHATPNATVQSVSLNRYANANNAHFRPAFALGASYNATTHWTITGSWMRILHHRTMPHADFIGLGAQYQLG